ncbi:hypothetical protein DM02DRAFT_678579 [Periconia macrospinosa]|uniref:Uncharacterized protein n=1 Tax=Periconia macrospinosa TaxID=97972 RepID=A0A2V1CYC2_9PLEO|nr:hypothetical protein DM02DRAFT_678579 [Periconia macrospinosa]
MPLYSVLHTDSSIQRLASDIAQRLGTPSSLQTIQRVPSDDQDVNLFRFLWTKDFQLLGNKFVEVMAQKVKHTIRQDAQVVIKDVAPGEFKMEVLFLVQSVYTTQNDELVILIPLSSDAFAEALAHLKVIEKIKGATHAFHYKENTLHLQSVDKSGCAEIGLQPETTFIIYGDVRIRTVPPTPFFMLSFRTIKPPV